MFNFFKDLTPGNDLGERALNAVASQSIRHLFTRSESVEVCIRCSSSKLLQGSIDSFKMSGRNLTIRKDFQIEEMLFETDAVSIDFRSALSGKIYLKQSTQAVAQVILSEAGINQAFKSELVKKRLQNIDVPALSDLSGGQPLSFTDVHVKLLPDNRIQIFAKTDLPNYGTVPIAMTATLVVEKRRCISFQNPHFDLDLVPESIQAVSHDLTATFAQLLNHMIDLDRFDLDGVMMRINRLETQDKQLIFSGYAQISHFPGTSSEIRKNTHNHEHISAILPSAENTDCCGSHKEDRCVHSGTGISG